MKRGRKVEKTALSKRKKGKEQRQKLKVCQLLSGIDSKPAAEETTKMQEKTKTKKLKKQLKANRERRREEKVKTP